MLGSCKAKQIPKSDEIQKNKQARVLMNGDKIMISRCFKNELGAVAFILFILLLLLYV